MITSSCAAEVMYMRVGQSGDDAHQHMASSALGDKYHGHNVYMLLAAG